VYKKVKVPPLNLKQSCEYDTNGKKKHSAQAMSANKHTHSQSTSALTQHKNFMGSVTNNRASFEQSANDQVLKTMRTQMQNAGSLGQDRRKLNDNTVSKSW
jgi:hypothetical protein